ncbi:MAG TPA: hypothetical protein VH394_27050 [Thermoanaerobaculia bacterium]|jgi:hypothetical protein|nr:hypothetical protein [Thermoanaerobaculia bacterium]
MSPAARPASEIYSVATHAMGSDRPIPALEELHTDLPEDFSIRRGPVELPEEEPEPFKGTAQVGTRWCRVRSIAAPDCDFLEISGAGVFRIDKKEITIDPEPGADEAAIEEALLGPVFALALAREGIFVLHASAVIFPEGVVAFLGDSGTGKSTLARLLVETGDAALAADDLLPIGSSGAAYPHFPQLKLDPAAMKAIAGLKRVERLLEICVLVPGPPGSAVDGKVLGPGGAAGHLLRNTIAGSLFSADLLTRQLGFSTLLASNVQVRRLNVPRRLDVGPQVIRHLGLNPGPRSLLEKLLLP